MRFLVAIILWVAMAILGISANTEGNLVQGSQWQSLVDVDMQGHSNTGDRLTRQRGVYYRGGHGGFGGGRRRDRYRYRG
ncbi:uncharacterized protein LOC142239067 [Haematobia irritans]|uniref:uncharacterized protein LOC142239067 n=1 Tax=Haematobia irritans TaxID=7368 RepID=UPI003F4F51D4